LDGDNVIVEIDGSIVTFLATNNWFGQENITFSLSDEGRYVVYDTVTVTVNPINDPPEMINIPNQTVMEGEPFVDIILDNYVMDVDDDYEALNWSYTGNDDLMIEIDENRIASISVPYEDWNGQETVTFTVTDSYDETDSDSSLFIVLPVNDAPEVVIPIPDQYVEMDFASFDVDLTEYIIDADNDELSYQEISQYVRHCIRHYRKALRIQCHHSSVTDHKYRVQSLRQIQDLRVE